MKNKHLVLLFLAVLALGIAFRWLPVRYRSFFESNLLRGVTASGNRLARWVPGHPDLLLERVETGWSAEQEGRTVGVSADTVLAMLDLFARIASFQMLKTTRPDTLGLAPDNLLRVRIFHQNNLLEHIEIGAEGSTTNERWTYLRLPAHAGIYRVPGHLRKPFLRTLDDFRTNTVVIEPLDALTQLTCTYPPDTSFVLEKNDSTGRWETPDNRRSISADSVRHWLLLLHRLNGSPFADHFDESSESETLCATIALKSATTQTLRFFYLKPPDAPEDLTNLRARGIRVLPSYVVHASTNPLNYFAVADTALVRRICEGLFVKNEK